MIRLPFLKTLNASTLPGAFTRRTGRDRRYKFPPRTTSRQASWLFGLIAAASLCNSARAQLPRIYPMIDCVEYMPGVVDATEVHFSFYNKETSLIKIPAGAPQNWIDPGPTYPGQLQLFLPGLHIDQNLIPMSMGTSMTWYVLDFSATAFDVVWQGNSGNANPPY